MTSIRTLLYALIKSGRPRQWIKNFALFAPLVFSGFFFYTPASGLPYFFVVLAATAVFCILTSSIYIINDIIDYEADRHHPFKRKRPIASGMLPIPIALAAALFGLFLVIFFSLWLNPFFRLIALGYLILQFTYAKYLKHMPILDVVSIATGFLMRIYAGSVVVNLHMNVWFLLTVVSASLFLAVAKRQSERTLLMSSNEDMGQTRKILKRYSERLLDQYTSMFATATWLTYALFAFQYQSDDAVFRLTSVLPIIPRSLQTQKLLMLTLPFVILGVMRYLQLVYENNRGESPDQVLVNDKPLLYTAFGFVIMVMLVLYVLI